VSTSKGTLRVHHRKFHARSYQCVDCSSFFESYQSYYSHKTKMHSTDKDRTKWICQYCNTSFSGSRTLRDHITIAHATIKPQIPYPVKMCNKIFLTTKRLRAHMKIHDDDSKEMCNECGLLVTSKHNLEKVSVTDKNHLQLLSFFKFQHIKRVHLKLRNFFCDVCGYSATFKHSIASHMVRIFMI
jgi:KRAB domain-containing zinc finger protein